MEHKLIMENWRKNMAEFMDPMANPQLAPQQAKYSGEAGTLAIGDTFAELAKGLDKLGDMFPSFEIDPKLARTLLSVISLFDPTGVTKWPNLALSIKDFKDDQTFWTGFRLCIAILEVLPVVGKGATLGKTFVSGLRAAWLSIKAALKKSPEIARALSKWLTKGDVAFAALS